MGLEPQPSPGTLSPSIIHPRFIHSTNDHWGLYGPGSPPYSDFLEFSKILHVDGFTSQEKKACGGVCALLLGTQGPLSVLEPFEAGWLLA